MKYDTTDRKKGSGHPRTVKIRENEEAVDDLVCSLGDEPATHMHPRKSAKELDTSHSSVCKIIKTREIKQF